MTLEYKVLVRAMDETQPPALWSLVQDVMADIAEGWEPTGGVTCSIGSEDRAVWAQAMIRRKEP